MENSVTTWNALIKDAYRNQDLIKFRLSDDPEATDLLPFLGHQMKTKRLRKKFLKQPFRYWKLLPKAIHKEFVSKMLTRPLARRLWQSDLTSKTFIIERIPADGPETNVEVSSVEQSATCS